MSDQIPQPNFFALCVNKPSAFLEKYQLQLKGSAGPLYSFQKHEHWSTLYLQVPQR